MIRGKHGSPMDRGSADRYYGRPYHPHYYPNGTGYHPKVEGFRLSIQQIQEYNFGYDNEQDRKDWG